MIDRRKFLALGAGAVVTAQSGRLAFAQDAALPAGYAADYAKLIEAAKGESDLVVYSNMSEAQWRPTMAALAEAYPWFGTVQTLDLNGSESMERYLAESNTGARSADLIITVAPDSWLDLIERDVILDYQSPEAGAYPDWSKPHPGLYTAALDPLVFIWNKALLPENLWPTGFGDLVEKVKANPSVFNGKLTSYGAHLTSYGYDAHYAFAKHHGDKVWDWYRTVGPQTRYERSSGPMVEKVTTGEYVLAYFCGSSAARSAIRDPARSQLVAMGYIADGEPMVFRGLAIPTKTVNVNKAKLLLDLMLSQTGQKALAAGTRTPVRPSVTSQDVGGAETYASIVESVGDKNIILVDYDPGLITDHEAFVQRWREANGV